MNIKDTVYIVAPATVFDMIIKNSVSIIKGEILAIKEDTATIKIEVDMGDKSSIIQQYLIERLCKTPQQALERANTLIIIKETKDESDNVQQG